MEVRVTARALSPMVPREEMISSLDPSSAPRHDQQQQSRRLKPAQPGHGKGLDLGAGAQKGPKSHQSQIEDQIKKGAGHLLQRDHS